MAKRCMVNKYMLKRSQDFVIGGYTAGNLFDALIVGRYEGAKLKFVAKVRKDSFRTCAALCSRCSKCCARGNVPFQTCPRSGAARGLLT